MVDFEREVRRMLARAGGGPIEAQKAVRDLRAQLQQRPRFQGGGGRPRHTEGVPPQYPRKKRPEHAFFRPIVAPHRLLVLPDVVQVNAGTDSATIRLDFSQGAGWVLGWRGTTRGDGSDTGRASMAVKCNINGNEPLVTNGQTEDFAVFDTIFPRNADTWSPLLIPMGVKDVLRVDFHNYHSVNNYTPALVFAFHDGLNLFNGVELLAR